MTMTELRLQKLMDLINSLRMGKESLMQSGRVDAARIIDRKIQELQRGYDTIMRQVETERELKRLTKQAKEVQQMYTMTEMEPASGSSPPTGIPQHLGAPLAPGVPGPVAANRARVRKRRKKTKRKR